MESATPHLPLTSADPAPLSLWARVGAIFARPSQAWSGLETHARWWFPLLLTVLVNVSFVTVLHDRAVVPTQEAQWEKMVESGQMSADQLDRARDAMGRPVMRVITVAAQAIFWLLLLLVFALGVWVSVSFVIGVPFSYRLALEVCAWSSLVIIPGQVITGVLAWFRQSLEGIHLSLAAVLPEPETPSKLMTGLTAFLDALGPFSIWWVVVAILGATALSKAQRPAITRVVIGLYLVFAVIGAGLAAMFMPARG
jgi:hypothetical protein